MALMVASPLSTGHARLSNRIPPSTSIRWAQLFSTCTHNIPTPYSSQTEMTCMAPSGPLVSRYVAYQYIRPCSHCPRRSPRHLGTAILQNMRGSQTVTRFLGARGIWPPQMAIQAGHRIQIPCRPPYGARTKLSTALPAPLSPSSLPAKPTSTRRALIILRSLKPPILPSPHLVLGLLVRPAAQPAPVVATLSTRRFRLLGCLRRRHTLPILARTLRPPLLAAQLLHGWVLESRNWEGCNSPARGVSTETTCGSRLCLCIPSGLLCCCSVCLIG